MTGASKIFFSGFAAVFVAALSVASSNAALLVYEPFDYPAGEGLLDKNGGGGFAADWTGNGNNDANLPAGTTSIQGASLSGPAGLPTQGGHVVIQGSPSTSQPSRTFNAQAVAAIQAQEASGGSLWVSFLAQRQGEANSPPAGTDWPNNPYPRGVNVSLFNAAQNDEITGVGNSSNATDNTWSIIPNGSGAMREGAYNPPGSASPGVPDNAGAATYPWNDLHWAVVRIDYAGVGGNQDMYLWLDPDPAGQPAEGAAVAKILGTDTNYSTLLGIGAVRPFVGNAQGTAGGANYRPYGVLAFDEFRVGTTYSDMTSTTVVPEPASLALLLFGGVALVVRRK